MNYKKFKIFKLVSYISLICFVLLSIIFWILYGFHSDNYICLAFAIIFTILAFILLIFDCFIIFIKCNLYIYNKHKIIVYAGIYTHKLYIDNILVDKKISTIVNEIAGLKLESIIDDKFIEVFIGELNGIVVKIENRILEKQKSF